MSTERTSKRKIKGVIKGDSKLFRDMNRLALVRRFVLDKCNGRMRSRPATSALSSTTWSHREPEVLDQLVGEGLYHLVRRGTGNECIGTRQSVETRKVGISSTVGQPVRIGPPAARAPPPPLRSLWVIAKENIRGGESSDEAHVPRHRPLGRIVAYQRKGRSSTPWIEVRIVVGVVAATGPQEAAGSMFRVPDLACRMGFQTASTFNNLQHKRDVSSDKRVGYKCCTAATSRRLAKEIGSKTGRKKCQTSRPGHAARYGCQSADNEKTDSQK